MKILDEHGVAYLFFRYHELLGFEDLVQIRNSYPDVIALKDGKEVRIELEYRLESLKRHYVVEDFWGVNHSAVKFEENKLITIDAWGHETTRELNDGYKFHLVQCGPSRWQLQKKSLKDELDYVVYYRTDGKWKPEGIQQLELPVALENLV